MPARSSAYTRTWQVYDLTPYNDYVHFAGLGAYHSGLEVSVVVGYGPIRGRMWTQS